MLAILYVNGYRVGELEYELPRDDRDRAIPTPGDHDSNEPEQRRRTPRAFAEWLLTIARASEVRHAA